MKFTTKTEYGIISLIYLAKQPGDESVSIKDLARDNNMSIPYLEKIFQTLRDSGIVTSQQGKKGGYSLARTASDISLREVIEAVEGTTFDIFCDPEAKKTACQHFGGCGVRPVWQKAKRLLDDYFESVTLEELVRGSIKRGDSNG